VKEALRKNGWEEGGWYEKVLTGVFGCEMMKEARKLEGEKDWMDLGASRSYMNQGKGKGSWKRKMTKSSEETIAWVPLGVIGEMTISDETFSRCCKEKEVLVGNEEARKVIVESLNSYKHSFEIDKMFEWFLEMGFGVVTEKEANTGIYVKIKPDGSKLQIISDRSAANKFDGVGPLSFRLSTVEKMKKILSSGMDVWFYSFDISNFFHSFIIPDLMRELAPTIYQWKKLDGSVQNIEALRLVFGSSFSPVVSHAAGCEVLGTNDTVFDKSAEGNKSRTYEEIHCSFDESLMYIDDFLEASVVKERARERFEDKRERFKNHGCGIKQSAVFEGVMGLDFAGKSLCGRNGCARIGNTRKNKVKCIALLLWVIRRGLTKECVESLVGSLCFLGSHLGWVFPFLNRAAEWCHGEESFRPDDLLSDLTIGLVVAAIPWSPKLQIMWAKGCLDDKKCIYVDAQNDFGRFGMVWWDGFEWRTRSVRIPKKYCCSQQCAELYGLKKAIGFGKNTFGREFTVAGDSIGSLHAICRFNMASRAWRRNQLFRAIIRDLFGEELMIWLLWIQSEWNPADGGSREVSEKRSSEKTYEGSLDGVFERCMGRTDFYSRAGSGKLEREYDEWILSEG
jgi:hypothetical protein